MPAFLLAFHGGRALTEADDDSLNSDAWYDWMSGIEDALIDAGNPTHDSRIVSADGSVSDAGSNRISGYSIVAAMTMDDALAIARTCPILLEGGTVEVSELIEFDDEDEDEEDDGDEDDLDDEDDLNDEEEDAKKA
jgi:hypothetical protein